MTSRSREQRASPGAASAAWLAVFVPVTFLAFPERFGELVLDGGTWLGPLSVATLLLGVHGLTPRRAGARAFVAGWLAHAAILHWIYVVTVRHGGAAPAIGVLAVAALALYPAAATGAVGATVAWLAGRGRATPVAVAVVFTLGDHLQRFVATGFPWSLLGYTQLDNPSLLPLARIGGVYLVGFGVALGGALLAAAVVAMRGGVAGRPAGVRAAVGVWLVLHVTGLLLPPAVPPAVPRATVRVAALQGSFDQGTKWSPEAYERTISVYETLTRVAARAGAELIVWPETAVPGPIEIDPSTGRRLARLARDTGTTLVVGAVGVEVAPAGDRVAAWYDSAFVIEPDGGWVGRYDKSHLVPFGEYVPFRWLIGRFLSAIARGAASLDVSAGPGPESLRVYVPGPDGGRGGAVRLGVPICYELLFPDRVRGFVDDGAQLLVAITNDAWYGRTGAPHQFLAITAMRAAETGVALVRAANTGVSAIVGGDGRVRAQSGLFERGYVIGDLRLGGGTAATFYARHGDLFVAACWAVAGVEAVRWLLTGASARRIARSRRGVDDARGRGSEGTADPEAGER